MKSDKKGEVETGYILATTKIIQDDRRTITIGLTDSKRVEI